MKLPTQLETTNLIIRLRVAEKLGMNFQGLVEFKGIPEQGKLFDLTGEDYREYKNSR